ncbi:MAG: hypothetical protein HYX24_07370 [Candidatus Aenigmarchaeota archaeon]|nr:hypothetical protein [Candidatus Aenigmarchaeota archaeon]
MKIEQRILEKLEKIENDVEEIREHMIDVDTILTVEEKILLDESVKNERGRKLISLEELENVRNKTG